MVTVHFSNTIILHPDTRRSFGNKARRNLANGRCRYGYDCKTCPGFIRHFEERANLPIEFAEPEDCQLIKEPDYRNECLAYRKQRNEGKKQKTFGIDFKTYSAIADRCAWMYQHRTHKLIFVVLSLPSFKYEPTEQQLNESFSKFIENLRENYHLRHYLAVREGDGIFTRYHYHCILDIRYTPFIKLNAAWNRSISDFCAWSPCAFRTKPKSYFIRDVAGAVRYISKYIAKCIGERSESRIFFCDRETAQAVVKIHCDDLAELPETAHNFRTLTKKIINDYVTRITFKSKRDQNIFFNTVVKYLFECDWNVSGMYVYSDVFPD